MMGIINVTPQSQNNRQHLNSTYQQVLPGGGVLAFNNQLSNSNQRNKRLDRHQSCSQLSQSQIPTSGAASESLVKVGSMNYFKRKKDILEINKNNKQLLKQLSKVQPTMKRDNLKCHQERIDKLKNHLVNVRYGQQSNFIFPLSQSSSENHNFNSSRFLFIKNPSIINIHYPSSTRNPQKIQRRRSELVSMGNYLNNSQKLNIAQKREQSPKLVSRSFIEDDTKQLLLKQAQKLKNARRGGGGGLHQRVQTAQNSPSKQRKHIKQNHLGINDPLSNSNQYSDFDNTRIKEEEYDNENKLSLNGNY